MALDRGRVHAGMLGLEGRSQHHQRRPNRHAGRAVCDARRPEVRSLRQWAGVRRPRDSPLVEAGGRGGVVHRAGKPLERRPAESFHSRLRDEFLALELFESLSAAARLTRQWQVDYNHHRPHSSLGYETSIEFAARCTCFRCGFGYASAGTPAAQRRLPNPTFLAPGYRKSSWSSHLATSLKDTARGVGGASTFRHFSERTLQSAHRFSIRAAAAARGDNCH